MADAMHRIIVNIPTEVAKEIEELKKTQFHDKSYTELYNQILRCGLERVKNQESN